MYRSDSKLKIALSEFQQNLSPDLKTQYNLAISVTPTPGDVLLLTDEINKKHSSRKSRVLSDRLRIVLECVQQWNTIVDTFVQANQIAALVWGSVKLVVKIALNFADYFEKLSKRFAQLSIYCPRLQEYEKLFPSSMRLQNALSDFYAIIVMFCSQALQVFSEKGVKRFVKSLGRSFKDDFQLLEENLSAAKEEIDREIDLASDQKIDQIYKHQLIEIEKSQFQRLQYSSEIEENTKFRSRQNLALEESKDLRIQKILKEEERRKIRLHQRIFCYDYGWSLRKAVRARCDNTGFWLLERADFREWREEKASNCLWLSGITGCGKTVLTGLVIDQLKKTLPNHENTVIIYYFFDLIRKESLSVFTFLRSILHQLIQAETLAPSMLLALETIFIGPNGTREPDIEELESLITELGAVQKEIIIIIDGIGEADPHNRKVILRFLKSLQQRIFVKLFISSQLDVDIMKFFNNRQVTQINIKPHDLDPDIRVFIENQVEKEYTSGFLSTCLPDMVHHIKQTLALKAKAMFLWVDLQIKAICDACEEDQSHENIPQLLNNLPEEIMNTYSYLLQRVLDESDSQIETAIKIFQWVIFASRPLTIDELEEAISITPEQKSWKQPAKKYRPSLVSKLCCNLIIVDEFDGTVLPAHHTVISFLVSHVQPLTKLHLHIRNGDSYLGETCIIYLNFVDFQKSLATTSDTRNLRYMNRPTNLITQVFPRPTLLNSIGLGNWTNHGQRSKSSPKFDAENQLRTIMSMINSPRDDSSFQLLEYCKANWHNHCHSFLTNNGNLSTLKKLITDTLLPFNWLPWDSPDDLDPYPHWPMLNWAVRRPHRPILQIWQESVTQDEGDGSWELLWSKDGDHLFSSACVFANKEQIEMFFDCSREMPLKFRLSENQKSAGLVNASALGHVEIVERLLQENAGVNALYIHEGKTALQAAAENGHLAIIKRLLQEKSHVNAPAAENNGRTALQEAAKSGHLAVVERLLQWGALVNAVPMEDNGRTALQAAAEGGHLAIIDRLIRENALVNAPAVENNGRTALQAAAESGHFAVIERLLQWGAQVNAPAAKNNGRTALQAAAEGGHLIVIELLIENEADVNASAAKKNGKTALQAAAEGGHLAVVERLLQQGAFVNIVPAKYNDRTPLQAAAEGGHLAVVERLLQWGALVNVVPAEDNGRTALQAAAEGGHLEVVELLIRYKADVNASAAIKNGKTALQAATENGHLATIERLLQENANVNAPAEDWGRTALQMAAGSGHLAMIERLLQKNANVNDVAARNYGRTALQAAAENGHLAVIDRLFQEHANVDAPAGYYYGRTALQAAAENGHLAVVEQLLQNKANVFAPAGYFSGRTALQAAAENGHLAVIDRLLQENFDVNTPASKHKGRTALQAAAGNGHLAVVERLIQRKADVNALPSMDSGRTALQAAAENGHFDVVERLLQNNAEVNTPGNYDFGRTALQAAAGGGHLAVVEQLLQRNANINARAAYKTGRTALQAAAENGCLDVVERLLQMGADVNGPPAVKDGKTALIAAAENGHLAVVERLLQGNAHVNVDFNVDVNVDVNVDANAFVGHSALCAAAKNGHLAVVERLLEKNADVDATMYGKTALQLALQGDHVEVENRLRAAGARE